MAELYLIRHGQASFGAANYDKLSDLGHQQARWLGEYYKHQGLDFGHIVTGDMVRQQETAAGICEGLGLPPQDFDTHLGLNEFNFDVIIKAYLAQFPEQTPAADVPRSAYYVLLRKAMICWSRNELNGELSESWQDFENRVRAAIEHIQSLAGKKRVIRDGRRRVIKEKDVENIQAPVSGQDLVLSIDQRVQYLAFKALQEGFIKNKAFSASLVVLDARNGEILAAVNQPAFNPNSRKGMKASAVRNRAMLDVFEPGSVVKPFVVAAALDGGYVDENIQIETHGFFKVGRNLVKDVHNYGTLDLMHVLKKSSNVAISKIALSMPREYFWDSYSQLGFGVSANAGFPGEASGSLLDYQRWHDFEHATLSYGYGVATSVLQLARAYTALADDGILHSVSLLKRDEDYDAKRVFSADTAKKVKEMLEHVIKRDGTAYQARVDGYRVAGKTGTVKKATAGGYADDRYLAVFVGLAPVSNPRFVIAVMVDEPSAGKYYGGLVAAPIFSKVMAGALRVYGVAPDKEDTMPVLLTQRK